jgi:ArsR family transcriptional regulator
LVWERRLLFKTFINIDNHQYVNLDETLKILKSLSDETRLKIVKFLLDGEKCVCEIFPHVKRTQSTVSIHLGNLERAEVLESRRDGKKIFYKIKDSRVRDIFNALGDKNRKLIKNSCSCGGNCK